MCNDNLTKICGTCKQELPILQFSKNKRLSDGFHRVCKQCCHDEYIKRKPRVQARYQETKEHRREYSRQYRLEHLDRYKELWARYYAENQEELLIKAKEYRDSHKEERAETMRKWRQRNKEHRKLYKRAYKAKNPDRVRLSHRTWARANRERRLEYQRERYDPDLNRVKHDRRRARKAKAGGSYSRLDIKNLYAIQGGKCGYCGVELQGDYDIDHYIPLYRGGSNDPSNLVLTCNRRTPNTNNCNQKKAYKMPWEWKPD